PDNNQGPWEQLESFSRTLVNQGNELYIIAGGQGQGGTGSNGGTTLTIANGHVTVPNVTWKVIIVIPQGTDDVSRVTTQTRTIAVIMPNTQGIRTNAWQQYIVSVDQVEALTGYDFFSNVPADIQAVIEARVDNGQAPAATTQKQTTAKLP
ncbi:MAG TPA: DNA/RNA non-specific endonuclease, partial [Pyrinomonadaceae bacterium]